MPSAKVTLGSLDQEIEMSEETASSERPQVTRADWAIVADLRRSISGEVIAGADVPDEFTRDFGGLLRARPAALVRPGNAQDVANALRYASSNDLGVTARAAGLSMGGQSLAKSHACIQLDLRTLNKIHRIEERGILFRS